MYYSFSFTTLIRWKNTQQKKRKYKGKIQEVALRQICDLVNCTESAIEIKVCSVQQQLNCFNSGVFFVTFLVNALDGHNDIGQNYNAEKMRFHFRACLTNEVFGPFLRSTKRSKVLASTILFVDIYCIYRWLFFEYGVEEDPKMFMVNCSKCGEWYHRKCIPKNIFENRRLD